MRLVWSRLSLQDRDAIFDYILAFNATAAAEMDERIASAARRLLDFPQSGRPGRVEGTRELIVGGTPYIAAYILLGERIRILRVLHGAQKWPDDMS